MIRNSPNREVLEFARATYQSLQQEMQNNAKNRPNPGSSELQQTPAIAQSSVEGTPLQVLNRLRSAFNED